MDNRLFDSSAQPAPPSVPASPSAGFPTDGDPQGAVPATIPGAYWLHQIGEELRAILTATATVPTSAELNQVATALQTGKLNSVVAGGTADAITASLALPVVALAAGMPFYLRASAANATTTPTFTPNSGTIAAKTIVKGNNLPLTLGDISGAGHWLLLNYDATLDKYVLSNPANGIISQTGVPVGATIYVPGTTAPSGFVKKNGSLLVRATYPALYSYALASGNMAASDAVWTAGKFSPGDGSTTFRIPDGRGEFIRGWDDSRGVDTGRALGSSQSDDFKSHFHTIATSANASSGIASREPLNGGSLSNTTDATGGIETRPRNIAELACIKF